MSRFAQLLGLPLLAVAVGCSNRPLAGTLDCFFPSRVNTRREPPPDGLFPPSDRDPLPTTPAFDPNPPRDRFRRGDLPPLGAPIAPEDQPLRREDAPWLSEPRPGAMPLPGGGR